MVAVLPHPQLSREVRSIEVGEPVVGVPGPE